jgi:ABC-type dipeptide/oligopeptide/nickel transport system ATPase subunit
MSEIAIKIEDLVKKYGKGESEVLVIDKANFTLYKGECSVSSTEWCR